MTLADLISKSIKDEKKIRHEFAVNAAFQRENPWCLEDILEEMKEDGQEVPQLEEILSFKESLYLNSMTKIFQQIKVENPQLLDTGSVTIYYYTVKPNFYKNQQKQGMKLGEIDIEGNLVTGSNLVIEQATINFNDFINTYYSTLN